MNCIAFEVTLLKGYLLAMEARVGQNYAPTSADLLILDTLIATFQISLDKGRPQYYGNILFKDEK